MLLVFFACEDGLNDHCVRDDTPRFKHTKKKSQNVDVLWRKYKKFQGQR